MRYCGAGAQAWTPQPAGADPAHAARSSLFLCKSDRLLLPVQLLALPRAFPVLRLPTAPTFP